MNWKSLLLLAILACLPYTEANFTQEAAGLDDESITESVYTSEEVAKARTRAFIKLTIGAVSLVGSWGVFKIFNDYIVNGNNPHHFVRYVYEGCPPPPGMRYPFEPAEDAVTRRTQLEQLAPGGPNIVDEAIFDEPPDTDYWESTPLDQINEQLEALCRSWLNKPWNHEIFRTEPGLTAIDFICVAGTAILGVGGAGFALKGLYDLWNLPKEGDPKQLVPPEPINECDIEPV